MTFKKYPGAAWKPLGTQSEPAMTGHHLVIVHTMVGYLYSTDGMFRQGGYDGTESHFGVGGAWGSDASRDLDGAVWQWQDLGHGADANLDANRTAISIETADNAPGLPKDIQRWTLRQAVALASLIAWLCSVEAHSGCPTSWTCHGQGIPLALVPDSKPGRRGVAYHRQGVDPWRVDGGQRWSTAYGKECPGPTRIRQLSEEIIPRARQISEGDMPLESTDVVKVWDSPDSDLVEHEALDKDPVTNTYPPDNPDNPNWRPASMLTESNRVTRQNRRSLLKLEAQVGEIVGDLTAVTGALVHLNDRLAAVETALQGLDLAALRQAIGAAGVDAAAAVRAAGEQVLEDLDRVRLNIDRG